MANSARLVGSKINTSRNAVSKKDRIFELREQGKSYNEIVKILGVAKGTVSYWLHGVPLSDTAKSLLAKNVEKATRLGFFRFNKERTQTIQKENEMLRSLASREVASLSKKDLFLVGVSLYWGEGYQSEAKGNYSLRFVNSNPFMIALFMRFVREVLEIEESWIKPYIQTHKNIRREKAIQFWSKITKLPPSVFHIFDQVSRASQGKRPTRSLPYGTLGIRINRRKLFFRMKGWIDGLAKQSV